MMTTKHPDGPTLHGMIGQKDGGDDIFNPVRMGGLEEEYMRKLDRYTRSAIWRSWTAIVIALIGLSFSLASLIGTITGWW